MYVSVSTDCKEKDEETTPKKKVEIENMPKGCDVGDDAGGYVRLLTSVLRVGRNRHDGLSWNEFVANH